MSTLTKVRRYIDTAAAWCLLGVILGASLGVPPRPAPAPVPVPAPVLVPDADGTKPAPKPPQPAPIVKPQPAPAHHAGHFTVSYIEPRHGSPASAQVRDDLAAVDWKSLDATFRSYVVGQDELTTLGFVPHFTPADLPVLFIQETGQGGKAPIVPPPLKSPASAAAVLDRIKELRGQ